MKQNRSLVVGRVWSEDRGDTRGATGFPAAPLGPSMSFGDATKESQWNDVPTWSRSSAAVVCFSY